MQDTETGSLVTFLDMTCSLVASALVTVVVVLLKRMVVGAVYRNRD